VRASAAVALLVLLAPAGAALAIADLSLTMTASPNPVAAGSTITYSITLRNNGNTAASNAGFSDTLPSGTVFSAVTRPSGWFCSTPAVGSAGNVVCAISSEPAGGGDNDFKLSVKVLSSVDSGTTVTNSATASFSTADPTPANNTASASVGVVTRADVAVTLSDAPDPIVNLSELTYTGTVTNNGPSDAALLTLDFPVPANTTLVSGSCTRAADSVSTTRLQCVFLSAGRVAGASNPFTLKVRPRVAGPLSATATVETTTPDPVSSNNSATATTTVQPAADIELKIDDSPDPVAAGNTITYTLTAENDGPDPASNVTLSTAVPANTTLVSFTAPGSLVIQQSGSLQAVWSGSTPADTNRVATLVVRVNPGTAAGSITLNGQASSSTAQPGGGGPATSTETTTVTTSADLALSASVPADVNAGAVAVYTFSLQNLGPSNAAGAQVTMGTSFAAAGLTASAPAGWTCARENTASITPFVCSASASLPPTTSPLTFRLNATIPADSVAGTDLTAHGAASTTTTDPVGANNGTSATVNVTTSADLTVTAADSPDPVTAGTDLTYAVEVRNLGPSISRNVLVLFPTGTGRVFRTLTPPSGWSCQTPAIGTAGTAQCTGSSLAPGTALFTMTVRVLPDASPCSCVHSVNVTSGSTQDPVPSNNSALVTTQINRVYDRAISLSDAPDPVTTGGSVTYTLQVTNSGPSSVPAGTEFTSTLPAGFTISDLRAGAPASCTTSTTTGLVRCAYGNPLAPGATWTSSIVATVGASAAGTTASYTATLTADANDANTANDSATASTRVNAPTPESADVSLTGAASPEPVTAGGELTYTLSARNNGPDAASNVAISVTLPNGTTFVSTSGSSCTAPQVGAGGTVSCTFAGSTPSGQTRTLTVVAAVGSGVAGGATLTANASAGSDVSDPNTANNTATLTSTVQAAAATTADVRIAKTGTLGGSAPSRTITYLISVGNGSAGLAAANVTLSDPLPAGTRFSSLEAAPEWACSTPAAGAAGTVSCTKASMAPGESAGFTLVVAVDAATTGTLVNTAAIATSTAESSTANNSASASVTLAEPPPPPACDGPPRLVVPIVLDVDTGSARFTTELSLTNRGESAAALSLTYTPALGERLGAGTALDFLDAGRQLVIPDVLSYLREKGLAIPEGGQQGGTLLVTFEGAASVADVAATARTTALTAPPQPVGNAGLAYSGENACSGIRGRAVLYGLRSGDADRSNLAVFNPSSEPVTFRVTVLSGAGDGGSAVIRENDSLPPLGWLQYTRILDGTGIANGIAVIETTSTTGAIGAYLVINDNATNDGSFITSVSQPSAPAGALPVAGPVSGDRLTLPVLVETPAFRSELVLSNRGTATATLVLSYVESLSPQLGAGGSVSFSLRAGEQSIVPDAIELLRSRGAAIGPRGAGSYAGAVRVTVSGAALGEVFAGARTASQSSAGGQFGLFTPGVYQGGEASDQAFVFGLRAYAETRANVAVLNAGADEAGPVTLQLTAIDGDAAGAERGSDTLTLAPGRWTQLNGFLRDHGVTNGWVRVRRTAGTAPWIAYGVVNDGGNPGERTGDGAFVPMVRWVAGDLAEAILAVPEVPHQRLGVEEVGRVAIAEAQAAREAGVLRARPDVETARGVEPVPVHEEDAETGQRLSAPADRRTGSVRAVGELDLEPEPLAHPRESGFNLGGGQIPLRQRFRLPAPAVAGGDRLRQVSGDRLPGDRQQAPAVLLVAAQDAGPVGEDLGSPAQHAVAPQEERAPGARRIGLANERHLLDAGEPLRRIGWLQGTLQAEERVRPEERRIYQPFRGIREPAEARHDAPGGVHLRLLEAGREPEAADGQSVPRGDLEDPGPRLARDVGVVEDHPRAALRQQPVELRQQRRQRAAALVAIQPPVALEDEPLRQGALAGAGQAHDQHHLAVGTPRGARAGGEKPSCREPFVEESAILFRQADEAGTRTGAGGLDPRRPGDRQDQRGEAPQPGKRDLEGSRRVAGGHLEEGRLGERSRAALHPAEGTVGEHPDPVRQAEGDHSRTDLVVAPRAQLELDAVDLGDLPRALELTEVHVAEADRLDQPVAPQRGQRPHAGRQRRPRVGRVELVERDPLHPERLPARLAGGGEMPGPSIGGPGAGGPRQPALGRDHDAGAVPVPGGQGAGDQPLVVPRLALVPAVGVGGVEEVDPGVEGGVQRRHRPLLVAVALGGEAHAADADSRPVERLEHAP